MSAKHAVEQTSPCYPWMKKARIAFEVFTTGDVELLSNAYKGDGQRHEVFHHSCGHRSWISFLELQALPFGQWCPHCDGTDDLGRFGRIEHLQVSVYHQSEANAFFSGTNSMGAANREYAFWCLRHGHSYLTTFAEFLKSRGKTNGCPLCRREAAEKKSPQ